MKLVEAQNEAEYQALLRLSHNAEFVWWLNRLSTTVLPAMYRTATGANSARRDWMCGNAAAIQEIVDSFQSVRTVTGERKHG